MLMCDAFSKAVGVFNEFKDMTFKDMKAKIASMEVGNFTEFQNVKGQFAILNERLDNLDIQMTKVAESMRNDWEHMKDSQQRLWNDMSEQQRKSEELTLKCDEIGKAHFEVKPQQRAQLEEECLDMENIPGFSEDVESNHAVEAPTKDEGDDAVEAPKKDETEQQVPATGGQGIKKVFSS